MKKLTKVELANLEVLIDRAQSNGQPIPLYSHIQVQSIDCAVAEPVNTEAPNPLLTNKYNRIIKDVDGNAVIVDVYAVLEAFQVTCPALQHLAKKALCVGVRGHKDTSQDLEDIKASAIRAIQLNNNRLPKAE